MSADTLDTCRGCRVCRGPVESMSGLSVEVSSRGANVFRSKVLHLALILYRAPFIFTLGVDFDESLKNFERVLERDCRSTGDGVKNVRSRACEQQYATQHSQLSNVRVSSFSGHATVRKYLSGFCPPR